METSVELLNESSIKHKMALDKLRALMLKTLILEPSTSLKLQKAIFAIITKMSPFIEEVNVLDRNPEYMLPGEKPDPVISTLKFEDTKLSFSNFSKEKNVTGAIYLEEADPTLITKLFNGKLYARLEALRSSLFAIEKRPIMLIPSQKQLAEYDAANNIILTLERKKKDACVVDFFGTGKDGLVEMAPQRFISVKEEEGLITMAISHGFNEGVDPQLFIQSQSGSYFFKSIA